MAKIDTNLPGQTGHFWPAIEPVDKTGSPTRGCVEMGSSICVGCGVGGPCGWRQQTGLFQQSEKVPFHRTKPSAGDGLSRNQDQVDRFEQLPAMKPEALAHHSASLISDGGLANPTAGDHPETGRGLRRKCLPICQKIALGQALTVFPVGPEIRTGLDTAGLWKNRS